jgi:hypothetical protein
MPLTPTSTNDGIVLTDLSVAINGVAEGRGGRELTIGLTQPRYI